MKIIKRSGEEVEFDKQKIIIAISKANNEVDLAKRLKEADIIHIANNIEDIAKKSSYTLDVESIQDLVEPMIVEKSYAVGKKYIIYRYQHNVNRNNTTDKQIQSLINHTNEKINQENSNKNPIINSTQRDYIAGISCEDYYKRNIVDKDLLEAHEQGLIHIHDMDYIAMHEHNCDVVNLEDMLQNGTVINGKKIDKPHKFSVACNIMTQIMAQIASSQYGGQTMSLSHLAPFVESSRQKFKKQVEEQNSKYNLGYSKEQIEELTEEKVKEDIVNGVQTIQYQINTLMTCNGQTPFASLCLYLGEVEDPKEKDDLAMIIEEVLRQRTQGIKNEKGVWITVEFPKLLYFLEEDNMPGGKYYYLTELAAKCTAKRMVPDYISEKKMKEFKNGDAYPCMGCRSFLTPDRTTENYAKALNFDKYKGHKYYGRFNIGVCTLNLVDVACSSNRNEELFWKILDERLELCYRVLMIRYNTMKGTISDVAPILWQYGALARLDKGETIDELLHHGYCTISLGYAGLYEAVYYMKGKSHISTEEGKEFGKKIMQKLNDACKKWKEKHDIDFSVYGTPLESTTYKFAKCLKNRFGEIPEVTDHNYITNSYHCSVREKITAFDKLKLESEYQILSPGGMISYVEIPNLENNIDAVLEIIKFIYDNIMYAELNTKSDYCQVCGYDKEIKIVTDDNGKLVWECPNCKNRDQRKMNVARRTCGYIGAQFWNQGRTEEIKDRVLHVDILDD